ncbi:hypothetical protein VNO77_05625 [Canavalia gladiata]|uniref:Uncharacterized protein n=1 Tax=Canavalia gladiata TaxID=3824 RepID=A0AAN9MZG3_CANGL
MNTKDDLVMFQKKNSKSEKYGDLDMQIKSTRERIDVGSTKGEHSLVGWRDKEKEGVWCSTLSSSQLKR